MIRGSGDRRVARLADSGVQGGGATATAWPVHGARSVPVIIVHGRLEKIEKEEEEGFGPFGEDWSLDGIRREF